MYKLFLTLRYLRKRRIAYFAVGAVMLCSAMVLIVMSILGGFVDEMKNKARVLLGDVIVDNHSYHGFPLYQEIIDDISKWPEISKATPVIYSFGLLRFPVTNVTATVKVVGIRLDEVYDVNGFKPSLYYENQYPGSTTLAEQQQPILGVPDGAVISDHLPALQLPPPLHEAFLKAKAAGVADDAVYDSDYEAEFKELHKSGTPLYPGIYALSQGRQDTETNSRWAGQSYPGLILGRDVVAWRQADGKYKRVDYYPRGMALTLTLVPTTETGDFSSQPVKRVFRYVDDSRTGVYDVDSQTVYCDFALLQKLLLLDAAERSTGGTAPARCSQIQLKLKPGVDPAGVTAKIDKHINALADDEQRDLSMAERHLLRIMDVQTWEESQKRVIAPIEKERALMQIVLGLISLVAGVLVLCILYMIVVQKTRDIGVIKSIGGSSAGVGTIFLGYGTAVGIVGGILGIGLGCLFMAYINEIQDFLIWMNPNLRVWDFSVYAFDKIPNRVYPDDIISVFIASIVACTLGAFAAGWRAATMEPVEALRYE